MKQFDWMPDFIIAGAMKAGTSTMDALLSDDPRVFIPKAEMSFFDCDDYFEHVDFFSDAAGHWLARDFDRYLTDALEWYRGFYVEAPADSLRGEQATTYLASPQAPGRIARFLPQVRIIIMLRNPAARAYSQYWHHVRTGRARYDFETTLRIMPERILTHSRYLEQVRRFLAAFPRAQLHFVVFEQFTGDLAGGLAAARQFLGLDATPPGAPNFDVRHNPARLPRSIALQLLRNRCLWSKDFARYSSRLRALPPVPMSSAVPRYARWLDALHSLVNPLRPAAPPPMKAATSRFLNELLRRENRGLGELIGVDLEAVWYRDP